MIYYIFYFFCFCYIISRLTCGKSDSKLCLIGKTAIITGANTGIGYATALNLASRGCRVIITGRTKVEEARDKIIKETNNANIVAKNLHLESFKSVRKFAEEINKSEEKIDILVHNAGIGNSAVPYTEDKLPFVMQVNYFAPFLLTHLLIKSDVIKKSSDARIVFVSSLIYFITTYTLETITKINKFDYSNSKHCQLISNRILSEKLQPLGITSNCVHPGSVKTEIMRKSYTDKLFENIAAFILYLVSRIFGKSVDEGAQTIIHLATSEKVKNVTGKYFMDCVSVPILSKRQWDKNYCQRLWKLSEELTGLKEDEKL